MTSYRLDELVKAEDLGARHSIRLAAVGDTGVGPDIDDREAELLGWVMGDGSVQKLKSRTPGSTHWRTLRGCSSVQVALYQSSSKAEHVRDIDGLMVGLAVRKSLKSGSHPDGGKGADIVQWHLSRPYSADLLRRSGYDHMNPVPFVLSLSPSQRTAFLRGVFGADGHQTKPHTGIGGGKFASTVSYSQADGPQQDTISLALFLNGKRPSVQSWSESSGGLHRRREGANIAETRPFIGARAMKREDAGTARVWCPTTGLGTWTARQERQVFLTGNSRYGSPAAAYSTWLSRSPHWYDQGGALKPGLTLAANGTGTEEWVVPKSAVTVAGQGRGGTTFAKGSIVQNNDLRGASDPDEIERRIRRVNADLVATLDTLLQQGEGAD